MSWDQLPTEILCGIFSKLDSLCDLVRCSLVSLRCRRAAAALADWHWLGAHFQLRIVLVDAFGRCSITLDNDTCRCGHSRHSSTGAEHSSHYDYAPPHKRICYSVSEFATALCSYVCRLQLGTVTYQLLAAAGRPLAEHRVRIANALLACHRRISVAHVLLDVRSADKQTANECDPLCTALLLRCRPCALRSVDVRACNLIADRPLAAAIRRICGTGAQPPLARLTVVDLATDGRWQAASHCDYKHTDTASAATATGTGAQSAVPLCTPSLWRSGLHAFAHGITFGQAPQQHDAHSGNALCTHSAHGGQGDADNATLCTRVQKLCVVYNASPSSCDGAPIVDALAPSQLCTEAGGNRGTVQQLLYLLAACKPSTLRNIRRIGIPCAGSERVFYELGVYLVQLVPHIRRLDVPTFKSTLVARCTGDLAPMHSDEHHAQCRAQRIVSLCAGLAQAAHTQRTVYNDAVAQAQRHGQQQQGEGEQVHTLPAKPIEQLVLSTGSQWSAREYIALCQQLANIAQGRWPVYGDYGAWSECGDDDLLPCLWREDTATGGCTGVKALTQTFDQLTVHIVRRGGHMQ